MVYFIVLISLKDALSYFLCGVHMNKRLKPTSTKHGKRITSTIYDALDINRVSQITSATISFTKSIPLDTTYFNDVSFHSP